LADTEALPNVDYIVHSLFIIPKPVCLQVFLIRRKFIDNWLTDGNVTKKQNWQRDAVLYMYFGFVGSVPYVTKDLLACVNHLPAVAEMPINRLWVSDALYTGCLYHNSVSTFYRRSV